MLNQIQLKRYAELSGYTEKALRDKISTGVWVEGLHYYRAPDRHILINVKEVLCRSEERRVGKECRSRWSPYH